MRYSKHFILFSFLIFAITLCQANDLPGALNDSIAPTKVRRVGTFACLKDSLRVVHSATTVWYGRQTSSDEYLSLLQYKGWTVGIGNESDKIVWRLSDKSRSHSTSPALRGNNMRPESHHYLRQYWHWEVGYGQLLSSAKNNRRRTWGASADWRLMYEWQWRGLTLGGGLMLSADYAGRMAGSNVNKPYSMDLSVDASLAAGVQYSLWAGRKVHLTFDYHITTPFAGCFFMPGMGQAYYEMSNGLNGTAHASSFHNKQAFAHDFHIDLRLQRTAWRIGIKHSFLNYHANSLRSQREDLHAYVGWLADLTINRGTKVKGER